jgi:hypothetical protein
MVVDERNMARDAVSGQGLEAALVKIATNFIVP